MSLSLSHGVSVIDTLKSCREVVGNTLFKQFIRDVEISVQEGTGLSPGFEKSKFIPFTVKQMVATGGADRQPSKSTGQPCRFL
jgi:type II secretory pathway component PulF